MSAIMPTQDNNQLTKPTDWASFMVTAALKYASDQNTPMTYTSADEARLEILNTLNWYEAHDEYEWPDFARLGFDFSQAMRFRRALVNDVFVALKKAGNVKLSDVGMLGTPDSSVTRSKRAGASGRRMAERKRHCKREEGSDTDAASDTSDKPFWYDQEFLAEVMNDLINRSGADVVSYLKGEKTPDALADIVHDGLVEVWESPVAGYILTPDELSRKHDAWVRANRSPGVEASAGRGEKHGSERP
ncbi:hypothetical protein CC86DRAFT_401422 [Ophiobolus disseminans]|uniref:Uncharacterized protein n=1 Tax=Ophiobolus disseminans TaxID=1469910 RepID=A0A6A7AHV1_9PLEO|nr:hypothetical protein CC86DRAFT_401422 [Ophiobolus disseminans]